MRADIRSCATGLLRQKKKHQVLPIDEEKGLRSLKTDDSIVIVSADKGGATVVMEKSDYVNKANQVFNDREAYAPLAEDPTKKQAAAVKKKVNELTRLKLITPDDSRCMTLNDPRIAHAYGLPKVHKEGAPLRIIVPLIGSPTYNLAKWLYRHLKHLTNGSQYSIKNSQAFLQKIQGLKTLSQELLPIRQVRGTPMGSPISGLLAELVLQQLEEEVMRTFKPKMWLRYVDDTFVIMKTCEIEQLHLSLNSVFPAIQFTCEEATGGILPFLDVSIQTLSDGRLSTSVYRKDSSADVILNYESNHPAAHKRSCVRTLFHRAYRYCSSDDLLKKELAFLYRLFRLNGYPVSFVKNCLRHQRRPQVIGSNEGPELQKFYSLPYMQGISETIARQLNRFGIFVAHKPASSVRATLSRVKDPIPKEQQSNVIYRIPCANCSCDYVGHTGRRLGTRINEHKLAIRRRDPLSLVFAHSLECDHRFNWEGTEVVAMANTKHAREFLEAWYSNTTSINRHVDLDAHYEGLRARLTDLRPRTNNSH
ncbi:hypothetical protein SprV_0200600400 [Sparganum proliferum]